MNLPASISRSWRENRLVSRIEALRAGCVGPEPPAPAPLGRRTMTGVLALLFLTPLAALRSSHLCNLYDADSLLPGLISLQKLTLFYWGQNRYGNLIPFLASWIHDINLNFQVQTYLRALGSASIPLLVFEFAGLRRHYLAAYAAALALMFLPFQDMGNYAIWVEAGPYGQSALLVLLAFLLQRNNGFRPCMRDLIRTPGVLFLLCLAMFCNGGMIVFAFPLWLACSVLFPDRRNWSFTAFLFAGFVLSSLLSRSYGQEYHLAFDYTRIKPAVSNLGHFRETFVSLVSIPVFALYFAVILAGFAVVQRAFIRPRANGGGGPALDPLVVRSVLVLAAVFLNILVVANMEWTARNGFAFRYFAFALAVIPPVCAMAAMQGISAACSLSWMSGPVRENVNRFAPGFAALALSGATLCRLAPFETPSSFVELPRRDYALALAGLVRQYGASFVAGDYYIVWPTVFEAVRKAQADRDTAALEVWGLAPKGEHEREEIAGKLRASRDVVVVLAGSSPVACRMEAFLNDATDWPPHVRTIASGTFAGGGVYSVLDFSRDVAPGNEKTIPSQSEILFHMIKVNDQIATRKGEKILVRADGHSAKVATGPYVNVPAGNYRVAFQVESQAAPAVPLFQFQVADDYGKRVYSWKNVHMGDMESRDGKLWLTTDFTVPLSRPTRMLEFAVWTFGAAPFEISNLELSRLP